MMKGTDGYHNVSANVVTAISDQVHKQHIKLSAIDVGGDDHISLK
jgi:hypothetical protein